VASKVGMLTLARTVDEFGDECFDVLIEPAHGTPASARFTEVQYQGLSDLVRSLLLQRTGHVKIIVEPAGCPNKRAKPAEAAPTPHATSRRRS
jgi:hypothetical protein